MGTETAAPTKEKHMATTENVPQIFTFNGQEVRTLRDPNDNVLFNANDICAFLEYANPRQAIGLHVDQDDVYQIDTIDSMGRNQVSNFVTEFGLYDLILGSRKKEAKEFKRWVTHEVLPSIRKTGGYYMTITREQYLDWFDGYLHGPMTLRLEAQKAADEKETVRLQNVQKRLDAKLEVNNLKERITILERQIDRLRDGGLKVKEQYEILLRGERYAYLDFHYLD